MPARLKGTVWKVITIAAVAVLYAMQTAAAAAAATSVAGEVDEEEAIDEIQWVYLILADSILLLFAALFAGLTLAIMGLDTVSLEIIADSGSEPDKTYASRILPIRRLGNQLLCTLILGNVMVNTLIAQITDSHIHGWVATIVSTALTTVGGEVIPQALMSAHALQVGAKSVSLVKFFVLLFYPICKPLSMVLDHFIGTDPGQIYERNELKKLMFMHADHASESGLGEREVDLMVGAMELHEKTVMDVVTPISEVLMLEASEPVNEEMIQLISERGHSRIPVYQRRKNNIIGVLFAKDLLMVDPRENTPVILLMKFYNRRCHIVPSETKLISMLKYFQTGRSHIALVQEVQQRPYGDPYYEVKGLVTMEDVIEELIHSEIFDEYDVDPQPAPLGSQLSTKVQVGLTSKWSLRVNPSVNQLKASALFLYESIPLLQHHPRDAISSLMQALSIHGTFYKVRPPADARGLEEENKANVWLYRNGVPSNTFTLLITGKVEVFAGKEGIKLELESWSLVAVEALSAELYVPTFSCRVVKDSTVMQITYAAFQNILSMLSAWEIQSGTSSRS
ncbi:CBS and cyclic nucleotide-binding protein domain-containing protein [Trypanosoma rangeli]|uniref:CBS and cyclic nucleotide-binding protein domain-containing protein n=1 Tax=Trypanosoma rangeli TaxID=5698 RepID=A0A422NS01_TRYRA|nr:CBS and cyclic nucleotide-binding protein domain-containing protein [Trypanosoma rangeli]RNF08257.1 CBS and cyclic nucleotide-binding protein domain-containing protein [Trypanosoma rangeli]|eukprot:RNF08257.1 CBS and cyclic nucleotide-binding protein domain-containing protein [Trypanosoma rangeli]